MRLHLLSASSSLIRGRSPSALPHLFWPTLQKLGASVGFCLAWHVCRCPTLTQLSPTVFRGPAPLATTPSSPAVSRHFCFPRWPHVWFALPPARTSSCLQSVTRGKSSWILHALPPTHSIPPHTWCRAFLTFSTSLSCLRHQAPQRARPHS